MKIHHPFLKKILSVTLILLLAASLIVTPQMTAFAADTAILSATTRTVNGEQYVDVAYKTSVSNKNFQYDINYDPAFLTYVSTAKGGNFTGTGTSVSASDAAHDGCQKFVVDATASDKTVTLNFDVPSNYKFTNTTGNSLSTCPNPVYVKIVARYTGVSEDIHGYELDLDINDSRYYPAQYYADFDGIGTPGNWLTYGASTHSAQPAPNGQNHINLKISKGIKMEFKSITLYSGWDASGSVLDEFLYAGDDPEQAAYSTVSVTAKSTFSKKTGEIAVSTFKVNEGVFGATELQLLTSDTAVQATGTTVALNTSVGTVAAQYAENGMRFRVVLPVDGSGEYYFVNGKKVRPISKGFLAALGYHAPTQMSPDTRDPYVKNLPVRNPASSDSTGNTYTLAVFGDDFEDNNFVAVRFYVNYSNGQTVETAYGDVLSLTRNALQSSDAWYRSSQAGESVSLTVQNGQAPVQTDFGGANAVAQGFIYSNDYTTGQISTELARMSDMDINLVRSYFDQTFNLQYNSSTGTLQYVWDRERLAGLKQWLQAMKNLGIDVALNMSWSISDIFEQGYTCYDGWNGNNVGAVRNAFYDYYKAGHTVEQVTAEYGKWVNQSVNYLVNTCKFTNITHLVMFTEPGIDYWNTYIDMVSAADNALKLSGNRNKVKIVGPNICIGDSPSTASVAGDLARFDALQNYIDVYSFHFYPPHWPGCRGIGNTVEADADNYAKYVDYFDQFISYAKSKGKEYWLDEFNYSPGSAGIEAAQESAWQGTQFAQAIVAAMNAGVQNALLWQLFEVKWPTRYDTGHEFVNGVHDIGLAPTLTESKVPYDAYYAYGLLTKYLGDGHAAVYAGTGSSGVYTSMVKNKDGKVSIVAVNTGDTAKNVTVNLSASLGGASLYRHAYDPATVHPDSTATVPTASVCFENVTNKISDTLAAGEVVIYTNINHEIVSEKPITVKRPTEYKLGGELTEKMVTDSTMNIGNRARVSKVMETLKFGGAVKIACIGGSITEGYFADPKDTNCFAAQLVKRLQAKYPQAKIEMVNAGIGATDSYIGVHRADEQVLSKDPDLVIIDFAVNDDGSARDNAAFESLIQKIWNAESEPAVLCVEMTAYNTATKAFSNLQDAELPIAQKYAIPMLSYKDMIAPLLADGTLRWSDIGSDNVHPNNNGHDLIAQMIFAYLANVANARVFEKAPVFSEIQNRNETYINANWLTPKNTNPTIYSSKFTKNANAVLHNIQGYWTSNPSSSGYMIFNDVSAQYIGVCYEMVDNNSACKLLVYVDSNLVSTIDPNGEIGHPVGVQVYAGNATGTHTVRFKTEGTGTVRVFSILTA